MSDKRSAPDINKLVPVPFTREAAIRVATALYMRRTEELLVTPDLPFKLVSAQADALTDAIMLLEGAWALRNHLEKGLEQAIRMIEHGSNDPGGHRSDVKLLLEGLRQAIIAGEPLDKARPTSTDVSSPTPGVPLGEASQVRPKALERVLTVDDPEQADGNGDIIDPEAKRKAVEDWYTSAPISEIREQERKTLEEWRNTHIDQHHHRIRVVWVKDVGVSSLQFVTEHRANTQLRVARNECLANIGQKPDPAVYADGWEVHGKDDAKLSLAATLAELLPHISSGALRLVKVER